MMRTRLFVALVAVIALPAFAPAPFPRPKKNDLKYLSGSWSLVRYERGGKAVGTASSLKVRIEGDKWMFSIVTPTGTRPSTTYTITIDPKKEPRWMDMEITAVPMNAPRSNKLIGIYRFDGSDRNKFEFVFHFGVNERPTGFDAADNRTYLMVLERDKP
jgi:uncharacterized protein (TIGR03067 family)